MAESVRHIKMLLEVDTNKRTVIMLDNTLDSINEAAQLLRNAADDLEDRVF